MKLREDPGRKNTDTAMGTSARADIIAWVIFYSVLTIIQF